MSDIRVTGDTKNGLTLVTGDKEPKKFITKAQVEDAAKDTDIFVAQMGAMGFSSNVVLISNNDHEDNDGSVVSINIGSLENATDSACDGMLHSLFMSIRELVELTPSLDLELKSVQRNILRSIHNEDSSTVSRKL